MWCSKLTEPVDYGITFFGFKSKLSIFFLSFYLSSFFFFSFFNLTGKMPISNNKEHGFLIPTIADSGREQWWLSGLDSCYRKGEQDGIALLALDPVQCWPFWASEK